MTYQANELRSAVERVKLIKESPHLTPIAEGSYDGLMVAAKNIRVELKRAFPKVKFSVTTSRYSGGDSLRVHWTDGPTRSSIWMIVDKYQAGNFDGMTDSYTYSSNGFTRVFGDAKYVFADRSYSDKAIGEAIAVVAKDWGVEPLTVEDFRSGAAHQWRTADGTDLNRELNLALADATF